jgi:cytochrome c553
MDQIRISVNQPRALAYDPIRDILYVAGYGDDELIAIRQASLESPIVEWAAELDRGPACGIDGLALAGDSLFVHCELARSVVRVDFDPNSAARRPVPARQWVRSEALASSLRSASVERGAELFRRGEDGSLGWSLACSSCHPEGRSDGLSWRLGRAIMQTPILAGRLAGTAPYKWAGEDPSLRISFEHTLERVGGNPKKISNADFAALEAFVLSLAPPRPPSTHDLAALARGQEIFERECSACHAGERTTDGEQYELTTTLAEVDTPSLIGLAHSAPYYHDGSAIDLETLLDDRGSVHDMIDSSSMSREQQKDLIVYLRSL